MRGTLCVLEHACIVFNLVNFPETVSVNIWLSLKALPGLNFSQASLSKARSVVVIDGWPGLGQGVPPTHGKLINQMIFVRIGDIFYRL